ncbi:MAG: hypothetical protein IKV21_06325 [Clostridia bacterium]|nr:hypothetical protein [Clostridia bacterium]
MKNVCTFFGHRDAPESIRYDLKQVLIDLIENKGVDYFLAGNNGRFDSMVLSELKLFATVYPHINYSVVFHILPDEKETLDWEHTLYPDAELETAPKRFTIDYRNRWMLNQADYVVTYVWKNYGGAYKFKSLAERKGKTVINLCEE